MADNLDASNREDAQRTSPKRPRSNSEHDTFNMMPIVPVSPNRLVRDWDCPDPRCIGQIEVFKAPNSISDKPAYSRCSEAHSLYGRKCTLPTMFAKKSSSCPCCKTTIKEV